MSPFTHADKIKKPLLLIHGEADNNTGALPGGGCCAACHMMPSLGISLLLSQLPSQASCQSIKLPLPALCHSTRPVPPAGTFPMQSERFYQALKGHGGTTRLVLLPHESHGYSARESIMHTLYEMDRWMDMWLNPGSSGNGASSG